MDEFLEALANDEEKNPYPEKYLHPDDWELFKWARGLINLLCEKLDVGEFEVEPKRRPLSDGSGVILYGDDRKISIAVRYKERAPDGGQWFNRPRHKDSIRTDILWDRRNRPLMTLSRHLQMGVAIRLRLGVFETTP